MLQCQWNNEVDSCQNAFAASQLLLNNCGHNFVDFVQNETNSVSISDYVTLLK